MGSYTPSLPDPPRKPVSQSETYSYVTALVPPMGENRFNRVRIPGVGRLGSEGNRLPGPRLNLIPVARTTRRSSQCRSRHVPWQVRIVYPPREQQFPPRAFTIAVFRAFGGTHPEETNRTRGGGMRLPRTPRVPDARILDERDTGGSYTCIHQQPARSPGMVWCFQTPGQENHRDPPGRAVMPTHA